MSKSALALLASAEAEGVRITVGDGLRASGPRAAVQSWLRVLRPHRYAVQAIIEAEEERAAIFEFEAGMTRTDAESAARAARGCHMRTQ